jgi:glycosyltransferase involved in cell wall biosynthesis
MKLLLVSSDSSIVRGQQGKFRQVLDAMSSSWERIDVVTPPTSVAHPLTQFGNVHIHPNPTKGRLGQLPFVTAITKELLEEHQHDLVSVNVYGLCLNALGVSRALERARHRPTWMIEVLHVAGFPRAGGLRDRIEGMLVTRFLRGRGRRADAVRVMNRLEVPPFLERCGIDPSRIVYVPAVFYEPEHYEGIAESKQYDLMFCGRLMPNKGLDLLLGTFEEVRRARPDTTMLVKASGGKQRAWLEREIARLNAHNQITIVDWVETPRDLVRLYAQARVLVCTSYAEGGPRVTVEAMACGVPVVSTRVGIMPEIVEHGVNGFLEDWNVRDLARACLRLLDDPALAQQVGAAGQESVRPMTRDMIIGKYVEGYGRAARRQA